MHRLITLVLSNVNVSPHLTEIDRNEMQYQSVRIVSILIKNDDQWLASQQELVDAFKQIWCSDQYQVRKNVCVKEQINFRVLFFFFCRKDTRKSIV